MLSVGIGRRPLEEVPLEGGFGMANFGVLSLFIVGVPPAYWGGAGGVYWFGGVDHFGWSRHGLAVVRLDV